MEYMELRSKIIEELDLARNSKYAITLFESDKNVNSYSYKLVF
jgi:hypothetical protein